MTEGLKPNQPRKKSLHHLCEGVCKKMDYLLLLLTGIGFYLWRKRLRKPGKPELSRALSKLIGIALGVFIFAIGAIWFFEFSRNLASVESGISREHFVGVVGIVFGAIFSVFGLGVSLVSLVSVRLIENWVARQHEDIQLW